MITLTLGSGRATADTTVIAEKAKTRAVEKCIFKVTWRLDLGSGI
jgi:hypothetical protein